MKNNMSRKTKHLEWKHSVRLNKETILTLADDNYKNSDNTMWSYDDFVADAIESVYPYSYCINDIEARYNLANELINKG